MHSLAKASAFSLLLFGAVTWVVLLNSPPIRITPPPQTITLFHSDPMALRIRLTRGTGGALIFFSHSSKNAIQLSVPGAWERGEVHGAPLNAFSAQTALDGKTWTIPAGASVEFRSPTPVGPLLFQNPTGVPLTLRSTTVNLQTGTSAFETFLVQYGQIIQ